jgi:flavodoxin long chain
MQFSANLSIGLIFGTDTGNTEEIGDRIANVFADYGHSVEMINVINATPNIITQFDFIIMGIPTWDFGGIQEDWEAFEEQLLATSLHDKTVALYGLGDQFGDGDYFLDAMGWLNNRVLRTGATVIGEWPTDGYEFEASLAVNEDKSVFCGLAIDEDQQIELTDKRVTQWVNLLLKTLQQTQAA